MTPLKPYLVRAIYEWIVESDLTPYMLVDASKAGVVVPRQYVQDGKIILNLNPQAVVGLSLGNESITFSARFGGTPMQIDVPLNAALALYAKETGKGMVFDNDDEEQTPPESPSPAPKKGRPSLKVIK